MSARFDLLSVDDAQTMSISYGCEADLRDGLHALALAYGWEVQAEVPVPNWGRIDLLIQSPTRRLVVELKASVSRPAILRRGLTQAHGYEMALEDTGRTRSDRLNTFAFLVAPDFPEWAEDMANVAYPGIHLREVSEFMGLLRMWAVPLVDETVRRLEVAEHEVRVRRAALWNQTPDDEPTNGGVASDHDALHSYVKDSQSTVPITCSEADA